MSFPLEKVYYTDFHIHSLAGHQKFEFLALVSNANIIFFASQSVCVIYHCDQDNMCVFLLSVLFL